MVDFAWEGAVRYFLPVLFLPFFLAGLWLSALPGKMCRLLSIATLITIMIYVAYYYNKTAPMERADDQAVWHYYPPFVEKLDAIADEYALEYGLTGYWEAKVVTLLSHRHLRVHQILSNPTAANRLVSFHWLSNSRVYFDPPYGSQHPPHYTFMLVKEFATLLTPSRAELIQRFGEPRAAIPCGPYHVFIYDRESDDAFQDIANRECYFLRRALQLPTR